MYSRFQKALCQFFARRAVEVGVAILIVISVVLTLFEFTYEVSAPTDQQLQTLSTIRTCGDAITIVFVIELTLRFIAAPRKRRFFRSFWLDIIAVVLPLFFLKSAKALRLIRVVRVLRLFGVASRLSSHFPYILKRGAIEYIVVCSLLVITVIFGTGAVMFFERAATRQSESNQADDRRDDVDDDEDFDFESSFWFSVYSLFAGEPTPIAPRTVGGKIVAVFVMFMGLTIFAMFTGTVSAFMIERFRIEGHSVDFNSLHDHVIICGWNIKAEIIIREIRASKRGDEREIVVITPIDSELPPIHPDLKSQVHFLNDDFTRIPALEEAGVHRARTCIILADESHGRTSEDTDARTILAALTVEKLNPKVYTCAEVLNRSFASHLDIGRVNDYVVSGEYGAYMLAHAAMNRGLTGLFSELLTYEEGNEFYRLDVPEVWFGKTFLDQFVELKKSHNAILVGVHPKDGTMVVNPDNHTFAEGDEIVIIAAREISLANEK